MNPHLLACPPNESPVPPRVYARVESVELGEDDDVQIHLDCMSVRSAEPFLIAQQVQWAELWRETILRRGAQEFLAWFNELELLHVELRLPLDYVVEFGALPGRWLELNLGRRSSRTLPAVAYTGLFAVGQAISIVSSGKPDDMVLSQLNAAFSMDSWTETDPNALDTWLHPVHARRWHAFDVGQGSANGLAGSGPITLFHDLGCGSYANAKSAPVGLTICHSSPAPIVLSHWDTDHWAGAIRFAPDHDPSAFLNRTWIVPTDKTIGPRHFTFAANILRAGGSLVVLPPGSWRSRWYLLNDCRTMRLIRGSGSDRNGSGVAIEVRDREVHRRWLLTGDVDYQFLKPHLARSYVAMSVPHHGAAPKCHLSEIPRPTYPRGYARLVYSFGQDNTYRHPKPQCIVAHRGRGWNHGYWLVHPRATVIPKGRVLATACNAPGPSHVGSALIGWVKAPPTMSPPPCGNRCNAHPSQH